MLSSPAIGVGRSNGLTRLLAATALLAAWCALFWGLLQFLGQARWAVSTPQELDYGEGIIWQQLQMIMDGRGYSPFKSFPAIVFHYPPVYHVMTSVFATASGMDDLAAGRTLSVLSTFIAAILIGVIAGLMTTGSSRASQWLCGGTASLASLCCYPIAVWSSHMRVDMLAAALSLGGLCLSMISLRKPAIIYLAALAFVCAVFTKQTMLATPGAVFLVLLFVKPQLALRGIGACLGLGLLVLAGLSLATHGEFLHHIFGYNINRFSIFRLRGIAHVMHQHIVYLLGALTGLGLCLSQLVKQGRARKRVALPMSVIDQQNSTSVLIAIIYVAIATFFLILVGKSGSTINYYVDWFFAVSIFVGVSVRPAADALFAPTNANKSAFFNLSILFPFLVGAGALLVPPAIHNDKFKNPEYRAELQSLMQRLKDSKRPVISDNMTILREAGKEVVFEPAIVAELTATKVYDERPFLQMIHNKDFEFFVTEGGRGDELFGARYSPAVVAAIYRDYPRVRKMAGLNIRLPALPPGARED